MWAWMWTRTAVPAACLWGLALALFWAHQLGWFDRIVEAARWG